MIGISNLIPEKYKNIAILILGNGFSAVIPLLSSPILTRIFSEEDFGVLTLYISVTIIISSFSTGRYHMGILEAGSIKLSKNLAFLSLAISILVSVFTYLVLQLPRLIGVEIRLINDLGDTIYLIPLGVFFISIFEITQAILNREKHYRDITNIKVIKSGSSSLLQLLLGVTKILSNGLVLGKIVGELISSLDSVLRIYKKNFFKEISISWKTLLVTAKRFSKYLKANTLHSTLTSVSGNLAPVILALFFSNEIVGYYGLSLRVCVIPVLLISQAFFQIFSREIVIKINQKEAPYKYFIDNLKLLLKFGILPFSVIMIAGPQSFEFIFGSNWETSGVYARILTPYLFTTFLVYPFTFIPILRNFHFQALLFEILGLIFKASVLFAGSKFLGSKEAVILFSFISTTMNILLLIWISKIIKAIQN